MRCKVLAGMPEWPCTCHFVSVKAHQPKNLCGRRRQGIRGREEGWDGVGTEEQQWGREVGDQIWEESRFGSNGDC